MKVVKQTLLALGKILVGVTLFVITVLGIISVIVGGDAWKQGPK